MRENPATNASRPFIYGLATLIVLLAITQYLAYQRYLLIYEAEQEQLQHEVADVKERFRTLLNHNTSSVNTLAILYKQDKKLQNFDAVAEEITRLNKYIDIIYLTDKFTITRSYPSKGNTDVIGKSLLNDPYRRTEALLAFKKKQILFAGPYELANGTGKAIAGRMPIYLNDEFLGFSICITRLSTINKFLNLNQGDNYVYQLSKINPYTKKTEYFFDGFQPQDGLIQSSYIPEGNWHLSVGYSDSHKRIGYPLILSLFGLLLSLGGGLFVHSWIRRRYLLSNIIASKTKELSSNEKYYRTIIETSSDAIVLLDEAGRVTYQTPSTEKITGYSLQDIQSIDGIELIHPDDRANDGAMFENLVSEPGKVLHRMHRLKHKNGDYIWLDGTYRNLLHDENVKAIALNYTDVTEKVNSEQKIEKFNRELGMLTKINDIILRCEYKPELYEEVCNCIVKSGGYKLAWIADKPAENDIEQLVKPLFAAGEVSYLNEIKISLTDPLLAKGPTATVLRTGKPVITNNITNSQTFKPWLDKASKFGISASCVLPLYVNNEIWGALNIYSGQINAFDDDELQILERLAFNLSLAIQNIRTKREKDNAEYLLKERIKELSTIFYVNEILKDDRQSAEEVFSKIVALLPPGWQYPESCAAKAHFDGKDYITENYRLSEYTQIADFKLIDGRAGYIEVIYTEEKPPEDEGPFLKEERSLINIIAETISIYFNKKINQDALASSEARFRGAFEHASIGMALVATNNRWLMVNKAICKILGYSEDEMLTMATHEITHPDDLEKETTLLNKALAGEIDYFRVEKRYYRKDGSIVWVNRNASLIRDASSNPLYFVSQLENITARIESQMKFQDLVENSQVGVYIIRDYKFVYANPKLLEDTGYTEEELYAITGEEFVHKDDLALVAESMDARLSHKVDTIRYEARMKRKDGQYIWMEILGNSTLFQGGDALIGTMINITDRKNLEQERQRIIQDLVQRNRDLEQFAHIISHNVRAPLSTILGLTGLINGDQTKDEKEITIKGIGQSAEQLDTVIKDLNEILHIRKDLAELKSNIDLSIIVEEVKSNLAKSINDTGTVIKADFTEVQELNTVRSYLHSIFYNLISNAIKYARPNLPPVLHIRTEKNDGRILLVFKDNGIGINLDKYGEEVFNMYKRFHLEVEGKGLGLFMVKTQVNALNGTIEVESTPGEGTTFTISFPA